MHLFTICYLCGVSLLAIYSLISLFLLLSFTNNIKFWRRFKSSIPFGLQEGTQKFSFLSSPRRAYWICRNPSHKGWVIFFHGWARNSQRMVTRGEVYWKRGYSLIFLDARSHGISQYVRVTTAIYYAKDAHEVLEKEGITEQPIVHGVSFGAIAAMHFAYRYGARALIAEALARDARLMFYDMMRVLKLPKWLFGWTARIIINQDFPWEDVHAERLLPLIKCPIFLIHGEKDTLFRVEDHFVYTTKVLSNRDNVMSWLTPDSPHARMARHPDYPTKIYEFLDTYVESPETSEPNP